MKNYAKIRFQSAYENVVLEMCKQNNTLISMHKWVVGMFGDFRWIVINTMRKAYELLMQ